MWISVVTVAIGAGLVLAQVEVPSFEVFGAFGIVLTILLWVIWEKRQDAKEQKAHSAVEIKELKDKNEKWVTRTIDQFVPLISESNALLRQTTETVVRQQELLVELRNQLHDVSRDLHEFEKRVAREVASRD